MGKKKEKLIMEKQFDDLIKEMKKLKKKVSKKMEGDYLEYKESDPTIDFRKEIKDLEETVTKYSQAINDSDNQIEKLQKEIIKLRKENESLSEKNKKLKEFKKQTESSPNWAVETNEISKIENADESTKSAKSEPNEDLVNLYEKKLTAKDIELNKTRCDLTEAKDEINSLKAQLSNATIVIERLQKEKEHECEKALKCENEEKDAYLRDVILTILSYCCNNEYIGAIDTHAKQIEGVTVYAKDRSNMNNFKNYFLELAGEIHDIEEIIKTAAVTLGYLDNFDNIECMGDYELSLMTRFYEITQTLDDKNITSQPEFITYISGRLLRNNEDKEVEN